MGHLGSYTDFTLPLPNMHLIVKVGSAVAKSTDTLLAICADIGKTSASALNEKLGKLVTYNADALALLGHVNIELSYRRRDAVKPNLIKEYSSLCGSQLLSILQVTKLAIRYCKVILPKP